MTNKPREFWIYGTYVDTEPLENMDGVHVIEAGPVLEKIKRLELALEKCKEHRNYFINDAGIDKCDKELESILEGR